MPGQGPDRNDTVAARPALRGVAALSIAALSVAALVAGGCSKPEAGSPAAVYVAVADALRADDAQTVYSLLSDDVRGQIAALHETVRETVALVDATYPPSDREAARTAAGAALLEEVGNPGELFAVLMGDREPQALSTLERFGSAPASTVVEGDVARVRTRGGDVWQFRRGEDGAWRWVPPEADRTIVRNALERARRNRAAIQAHLAEVEKLRARGVVRALPIDAVTPDEDDEAAVDAGGGSADGGEDAPPSDTAPESAAGAP